MKVTYLSLVLACMLMAVKGFGRQADTTKYFILTGQVEDPALDSVSVEYINYNGQYILHTVPVSKGKFSLKGDIDHPVFSFLLFKHKGETFSKREVELKRIAAFLEPKEMLIDKLPDTFGYLDIKGSATQQQWKELKAMTQPLQLLIDSVSAANDRSKLAGYQSQLAELYYAYFLKHTDSYVTADRVKYFTGKYSTDSLKTLYNKFSPELKTSVDGRRLAAEIRSREVGLPGTQAYAFNVKDKDDKELSLDSFKGKYVLLDFWATWCVPCRKSMPHLISLHQKYKDKNFVMIGIGDDDRNVKGWLDAIAADGTGLWYQTLRGLNAEMFRRGLSNPRDLGQQYGIRALPTKILIDPNGKIIGRFGGSEEDLDKMLAAIFK